MSGRKPWTVFARNDHRRLTISQRGHMLHGRIVFGQVDHAIGNAAGIQRTGRRGALYAGGLRINGDGHGCPLLCLFWARRSARKDRGHLPPRVPLTGPVARLVTAPQRCFAPAISPRRCPRLVPAIIRIQGAVPDRQRRRRFATVFHPDHPLKQMPCSHII